MKIEIDSDKILSEVIERDGSIHLKIRDAVSKKLIEDIYSEVRSEFIDKKWNGAEELSRHVIDDLEKNRPS